MPAASFQPAVALFAFGILVGLDNSVCDLNENGLEVNARARNAGRFHFTVALVVARGQQPVQETRCFAVGNTDISAPISERIAIAVKGSPERPGAVRIRLSWAE